jgi:hypothetical protein
MRKPLSLAALTIAAVPLFISAAAAQSAGVPGGTKLAWFEPSLVGLPPARCCASIAYDAATGETVLFGGRTYSTNFDDTWVLSKNAGWTQLTPAVSPPAINTAGTAYDPTTQTVVLFGGSIDNSINSNETWTWDGATWTQQFPPVSPPARGWNTNGMVFDAHLGKVVMFGGVNLQFDMMNDTWEWDGTAKTWTQQFPAHSPSPRDTTLAYDDATNQIIFFGGWTNGVVYGDTWTYNGVDWVQQQPATVPQARADNALAFDSALKSVMLYGGLAGPCEDCGEGRLNDTWLWNGTNWNQVQASGHPVASSGASFTYDASIDAIVLFGGWISSNGFTNSTWLFRAFQR